MEVLTAPESKNGPSTVMTVSREPHSAQGWSHVQGKTKNVYQKSTGSETNDHPFQHMSGSDCLRHGIGNPLECGNRLTYIGKASSNPCEPLSSGSPDDMKNITPCEPSSLGKPSDMKQ